MKPKVFVIGDSISWYYGQYLQGMLQPFARYDRKGGSRKMTELADMTDGINGGHSGMVLTYLKGVMNETFFRDSDYLMFNCGIHDVKRLPGAADCQVPLKDYRDNLEEILRLAPMPVIWVTTTAKNPIAAGGTVHQDDLDRYQEAAVEIMKRHQVPILDLNAFTRSLGDDLYLNHTDTVHFNTETQIRQAAFICGWLAHFLSQEI